MPYEYVATATDPVHFVFRFAIAVVRMWTFAISYASYLILGCSILVMFHSIMLWLWSHRRMCLNAAKTKHETHAAMQLCARSQKRVIVYRKIKTTRNKTQPSLNNSKIIITANSEIQLRPPTHCYLSCAVIVWMWKRFSLTLTHTE